MSARRSHNSSSSLTNRRTTKSLSELINEQFDKTGRDTGSEDDWDFGGRADDYDDAPCDADDFGEESESLNPRTSGAARAVKRPRGGSTSEGMARETKRLRRRGPLDASLSEGTYAARPVDALMDDIFGALEAGDEDEDEDTDAMDAEAEEEEEEEEDMHYGDRDGKKKHAVRVKSRETEAEYTARLEKRLAARRGRGSGSGGQAEEGILAQLEDIRAAQLQVLPGSGSGGDAVEGAEDMTAKERERAQAAVRHYVMVYAQLLRVRIRLQPAIARAVALPQYYAMGEYVTSAEDAAAEAHCGAKEELTELLTALHALAEPENKKVTPHDPLSFRSLELCHRRIMRQVDTCVEYWGSRLTQPKATGLHAVAQPLLDQIRAVLTGRARLRAKVQKNRNHTRILGHPGHYLAEQNVEGKAARALRIADGDVDEELYDDGEFLREVVKRGGVAQLEQQLRDVQREMREDKAPERRGFHKMTKGKAINYEPRPKLVGFLAPVPYALSGQHEAMMASLFQ